MIGIGLNAYNEFTLRLANDPTSIIVYRVQALIESVQLMYCRGMCMDDGVVDPSSS